jgi:hypothetical protein
MGFSILVLLEKLKIKLLKACKGKVPQETMGATILELIYPSSEVFIKKVWLLSSTGNKPL